jgi:hypothetical protein
MKKDQKYNVRNQNVITIKRGNKKETLGIHSAKRSTITGNRNKDACH